MTFHPLFPDQIRIWTCWFFMEGGKPWDGVFVRFMTMLEKLVLEGLLESKQITSSHVFSRDS